MGSVLGIWLLSLFANRVMLPLFPYMIGAAIDLPWLWVVVYASTLLGYCWVGLAMLGPRTTLKCCLTWVVFTLSFKVVTLLSSPPSQSCELLFYCGMQWLVFGLLRIGLEAGYAWETSAWSHSYKVRLMDFFSTTLEEYWKGKSGPEGLWNREMIDSWCWVCGCLRGQG